jgi:replicative DNA helicase Mcm
MANRSICCIDEFSKIAPQDRVALQEAMSVETVSIAKASIVATLPAQTAVLAGGNPKLGRFDPFIPIRDQVDVDDVLLSRFDLKFALRDIPNPELDTKVADHILKMRHFHGEEAIPILSPEFLRKYISYARSRIHPQLTEEVGRRLKEFYLEMRAKAGEEAPVSITLRQYEALIRMAEASARIRLSNTVEVEDAERAIRLMKLSLRQFGFEPETGKIDIDRAEGLKFTAVQRSKTRIMEQLIDDMANTFGKEIPIDEVRRRAKAEGVEGADDILRRMQEEAILYVPKIGFVAKA